MTDFPFRAMPALAVIPRRLAKRVPLRISRGVRTHSEAIQLRWSEDGVEGWGEAVPFSVGGHGETVEDILADFEAHTWLRETSAWDRQAIDRRLFEAGASSAFRAAVSQAVWDWTGKRLGCPVWRLLGLTPDPRPFVSATIGISSPDEAVRRVRQWQDVGEIRFFKMKLGSPEGVAADRAMFSAVHEYLGPDYRISVDANGGWLLRDAIEMSSWLQERGVDHLEQPLARGREDELPALRAAAALPVFVDESCCSAADLLRIAGAIGGINIKLMKCGGIDEALRLIALARAHGLKILLGCYSNTTLGNTAAAALGGLVDYLDLDSHLNVESDPFVGVALEGGRLHLPPLPGFGVSYA